MSDSAIVLNQGVGGESIKTDKITGIHTPVEKVAFGSTGTVTPVDAANPLPVTLKAGTDAIGKLAANDGVDIGNVDVASQPARSRTVDAISAALATDKLMNGTTELTLKRAVINESTTGDKQIVAAVTSKKIRVINYSLHCNAANTVQWKSGSTALGGARAFAANGGIAPGEAILGHFETAAGAALNLNLSTAVQVSGELTYVEV